MTARCVDPICDDGPPLDCEPDAVPHQHAPGPRFADDGSHLCKRCGLLLEQRLAEMKAKHDAVAHLMLTSLPSRGGNGGGKRTKAEAPPVELNVGAHDWIVEATGTLVSWTRMVCEERALRGPDRSDVGVLSGWLLAQLPYLLAHGAVGDLAEEMRDLTRAADSLTRVNPRRYRLPAPCPHCDERELTREDGADHVWCDACQGIWREDEYPWMVRVALAGNGGCVTAAEGASRAGIKPDLFRQWVSRGKVRRLGTVDGTARYSTSDIDAQQKDGAA